MRRRLLVQISNNSDYTRSDTDDSMEIDTDLIDVNGSTNINNKNNKDKAWLSLDKDHPHEHYL